MVASNRARCIANTLVYEGGFTIARSDPGNWTGGKVGVGELKGTNFGIAANTYPNLDIKNLTKDRAIEIYSGTYWPKSFGDSWPMGIDQVTYDATVNSGPGRGPGWTVKAAGAKSVDQAALILVAASFDRRKAVVKAAVANRLAFMQALSTWSTFKGGWTKRCAAMEALGVKMVLEDQHGAGSSAVATALHQEAGVAEQKTVASGTTAGSAVAGGGITAPHVNPSQFDWTAWTFAGGLTVLLIGAVAFFAWQTFKNRERQKAYVAAAQGV